jgi:mono/diheme cytochrome c family protein
MSHPLTKILAAGAAIVLATAAGAAAPRKTPDLVAKGKESYAMNCAACHGDSGKGDGVAGGALDPKPRNLVTGKFTRGAAPAQVFETVSKGLEGSTMVGYAHLPEEERWALTYYVLDLRGGKVTKK